MINEIPPSKAQEQSSNPPSREKQIQQYIDSHPDINLKRYEFWLNRVKQFTSKNNLEFSQFIEQNKLEEFEKIGDALMYNVEATGYGIDLFSEEYPNGIFSTDEPAIFYSCEIDYPEHMALLLEFLERQVDQNGNKIVSEEQIDFGLTVGFKANKFIWTDDYEERDPSAEIKPFLRKDGVSFDRPCPMEAVLKISKLNSMDHIRDILIALDEVVFLKRSKDPLPGSYVDPDIRIDLSTSDENLEKASKIFPNYIPVISNSFTDNQKARIMVLRKKTSFNSNLDYEGWSDKLILVNELLGKYIENFGVAP